MAYYKDLSACDYFGTAKPSLVAIGWLDREHAYAVGEISKGTFDLLFRLLRTPWQSRVFVGRHRCNFCLFSGGPVSFQLGDMDVDMGVSNAFIPTNELVYVAPSLILHYIDSHQYCPPDEFLAAVEACPPMGSREYVSKLVGHGISAAP